MVPGWVAGAALLEVVGGLPLLTPMSKIAGRLSVQHASQILLQTRGVLLGGIAEVEPAHVVVLMPRLMPIRTWLRGLTYAAAKWSSRRLKLKPKGE